MSIQQPKTLEIEMNEGLKDLEILKAIDLDEVEEFNIYFWKPLSLRFLKDFKNLKKLMIVGRVKDFSHVSNCSSLEELYISGGPVNSLDFIKSLSIHTLRLEQIRSDTDSFIIPNLKTLEYIAISTASKIVDLSFLSEFSQIKKLSFYDLKSKNLFDFSKLTNLQTVTLTNMFHLKNFSELSTLQTLNSLVIHYFFLNRKMKIDAKSELLKVIDKLLNVKTVKLHINNETTEKDQLLSLRK